MDSEWTKDGQNHIFIVFGQGAFLTFLGVKKLVLKNSKHRLMGPFLIKMDFGTERPKPFFKNLFRGIGALSPKAEFAKKISFGVACWLR